MKTYTLKAREIEKAWHVLDAADVPLGRLAAQAATLLRGKHKPTFTPHLDMGDFVVVVNAEKIRLSSSEDDKKYYRHSGYPGGLRVRTFRELREKHPDRIIEMAVKGMLPHNKLGARVLRHLKVYAGPEHPHAAQLSAGTGARSQHRKRVSEAGAIETAAARRVSPPRQKAAEPTPAPTLDAPPSDAIAVGETIEPSPGEEAAADVQKRPSRRAPRAAASAADTAETAEKPKRTRRTAVKAEPEPVAGEEGSES